MANVALGKTYRQSSTFNSQGPSSNAANGDTSGVYSPSNCIHTNYGLIRHPSNYEMYPWWEVDLGRMYPIYNITVWARESYNHRLYPFEIAVGRQYCVRVSESEAPPGGVREKHVTCSTVMYGQVVRLTLQSYVQVLNLCEFRILVPACPSTGSTLYTGTNCDQPCTGVSPGCAMCTTGGLCAQCKPGHGGSDCTDCLDGYYKPRNGVCVACSQNCDSRGCDRNNGRCYGCTGNIVGNTCTDCVPGNFGSDCTQQCDPHCTDTGCYRNSGYCLGCKDGYYGDKCETACSQIAVGCATCLQQGTCISCKQGFSSPACTDCKNNTYGKDCLSKCGHCEGGQPCDAVSGDCAAGCLPGWIGTKCDKKCPNGRFGGGCNQTCGQCQVNTTCHHVDGHCLVSCASGFTGPLCLQEADSVVSEDKEDGGTNSLVGPVVGAIFGGFLLMTLSLTAAVCWRRRSQSSRNGGSENPVVPPKTWREPEPSAVRQSAVSEDNTYSEVRDPDDNYEIPVVTNNYDKLTPYSNDDANREPYMQMTSRADDVNTTASSSHYANTEQSV